MVLDVNRDTVTFVKLGLYHSPLIKTQDGGLGVRITDFAKRDILHPERARRKILETNESIMYALDNFETENHQDFDLTLSNDMKEEVDPSSSKAVPRETKDKESTKAKASAEATSNLQMDERSSPGQSKDWTTQMHQTKNEKSPSTQEKEVSVRLPSQDSEIWAHEETKEGKGASTSGRSTPFFRGTNHKELLAFINARDNQEVWAKMLEAEHRAHDWWEAYQILQQNNDTKQSTMMMLIYHQNLHWLKSRQISGLAHKVRFSSCQEQYGESPSADVDVFAQVPMGVLWPNHLQGQQ
jgi:hypothetical protein